VTTRATPRKGQWVGVDLDGTLAEYHGWVREGHIGEPLLPMVRRVRQLLAAGWEVKILTARLGEAIPSDKGAVLRAIRDFCLAQFSMALPVTMSKDQKMVEFYDDRCRQVVSNKGVTVEEMVEELCGLMLDRYTAAFLQESDALTPDELSKRVYDELSVIFAENRDPVVLRAQRKEEG
jgi:hypothetical protein